jgi:arylsulfatase A-like enzyme
VALSLVLSGSTRTAGAAEKLNVVLILADDLGWTDLGCYGSDLYQTPTIDKLAADGVKFTQAYSACTVCSPSRASLLTGKYPARLHITDWIPGMMPSNPKLLVPDWTKYLPKEEPTIADAFHAAGYKTACIGKWHLGGEEYYPDKHGFDVAIGGTDAAATKSYFAPWNIATLKPEGKEGEYLTDRLGDEAVKFIHDNKDRPFFLYFAHNAVHQPVQGKPKLVQKYKKLLSPEKAHHNAGYAAMDESMDDTVGRVRAELQKAGIADKTIVIFTSDNGGRIPTTANKPLRAGKGGAYEGGVRVPLIVYWPGVTKAGAVVADTPVIGPDLYPTILEMTGVSDVAKHKIDGVSIVPLLRSGGGAISRGAIYWHYPHHQWYQQGGTMPYGAIRSGDYKLIEFFDDMHVELYDVKNDISESKDLAAAMLDKTNPLREKLHAWRKEVGAQMPTPNPKYDSSKPQFEPKSATAPATRAKDE